MTFPRHFLWGAATSSYQIEGAHDADGKGACIWNAMCRAPGKIRDGSSGDIACDHYHRYAEDVALMADLGIQAYRFSISWPRVIPLGEGKINAAGLDFYDRLTDRLLERGMIPFATLFHWDYPLELYKRGGWLHADSPAWFAAYVDAVVSRLSDRITHWITFNEPQVVVEMGHVTGEHAPGVQLPLADTLLISHRILLAHGRAVQVIRERARKTPRIGMAPVASGAIPFSPDEPQDVAAARNYSFAITGNTFFNNTWMLDPLFFGHYPADGLNLFKEHFPQIGPEDMRTIQQKLDFFGVNIYHARVVKGGIDGKVVMMDLPLGHPRTAIDWPITPECLYWLPKFFYERYSLPVYITENGLSNTDWIALDGAVHDPQRIDFTARHLQALGRAIDEGIDIRGYFHWSLLDNFEWSNGYHERFGLVHVDYATQQRTIKDSGYWYRDMISRATSSSEGAPATER